MEKKCSVCGEAAVISLQKLIYQSAEISNVPIVTCKFCDHSDIVDENVKADLKRFLRSIEKTPEKKIYPFEKYYGGVWVELLRDRASMTTVYQ